MMKNLRTSIAKVTLMLAFVIAAFASNYEAKAQYCIPGEVPDYATYYCWSEYYWDNYGFEYYIHAWWTKVQLQNMDDATDVRFLRESESDRCYINTEVVGDVVPGESYDLVTTRYQNYYGTYSTYNTARVWIDWNVDGDFQDPGEMVYQIGYPSNESERVYMRGQSFRDKTFKFDAPDDAPLGETRMRLTTTYYYPYGTYDANWRNSCYFGYQYDNGSYGYYYAYGETEDYTLNITIGVKDMFPRKNDILVADEDYDGTTRDWRGNATLFERPFFEFKSPQGAGTKFRYRIKGPLPSSDVVYTALDGSGNDIFDAGTGATLFTFTNSSGSASPYNNGVFNSTSGGVYQVEITIWMPNGKQFLFGHRFTVAWDDDMSTREIVSPKTSGAPRFYKYLIGNTIPVTAKFMNTGLNQVTEFDATAQIYNANGQLIEEYEVNYDSNDPDKQPLDVGDQVEINFGNVRFNSAGTFTMLACCDLLSAVDQEAYNDCIPRTGDPDYTFEVTYEIQLQAFDVFKPNQDDVLVGSRPFTPRATFRNVGIGDASEVPARMVVTNSAGDIVYEDDIIIQDIPSGKYNTRTVDFARMVIRESGEYTVCISVNAEEDEVLSDNELCETFSVEAGLSGNYTVGMLRSGQARNFNTILEAMEALYLRGLVGSVEFTLTDANYTMSSPDVFYPAWEFGSTILGLGYDAEIDQVNTITWKPSTARAIQRGGVTVNLNSSNGIGIRFGQAANPGNKNAIKHQFPGDIQYFNNAGNITFDGGQHNGLKFVLNSTFDGFGAALYLGTGSENISIKNVIVENNTPSIAGNHYLPLVNYNPQFGVTYEDNFRETQSGNEGYSAGIVIRSRLLPIDVETGFQELDTLPAKNNLISGNEIEGFGYGVVSLGYGQLLVTGDAKWRSFYNKNNVIKDNKISNVAKAGIFLGFEDGAIVSGNTIYSIDNDNELVAGIMAGGGSRGDFLGYHNVNAVITGNEISDLSSEIGMAGVIVDQVQTNYQDAIEAVVFFPNEDENMQIINNVVHGFNPSSAGADRVGIHVMTERDPNGSITDPRVPEYWSRNDKIINNTIIINSDNGLINSGAAIGIGLQQTSGASVYNNAIAILDNDLDASSPVAAAIFYQGDAPETSNGLNSDMNAYWFDGTRSNAATFRMIETEENGIIEMGTRNEFTTLDQWRVWTGNDQNSVFSDFTRDLEYIGSEPMKLRVISDPYPLGSVLDNRGEIFDFFDTDIDENPRGTAGQRYDIGAEEFAGRVYVADLEILGVPTPASYKSTLGEFSDAEHIMTASPIEIEARVRNNGSLQQNGIEVTVSVYLEDNDGNFSMTPEFTETVTTDIASQQAVLASFNLADGMGQEWYPSSYMELLANGQNYVVPEKYTTMIPNVTPRYRIDVSLESDQNNSNNISSKVVRFYLLRSDLRLMVSAENSYKDISSETDVDIIAGQLNSTYLLNGFIGIGWHNDIDEDRVNIDVFERTAWEPRAVNYEEYRTLFWSDGDDKVLTRLEQMNLEDYLNLGTEVVKKNLMIASQEMVRELNDNEFATDILGAYTASPGNPLGTGSYDGNEVLGVHIQRDMTEMISATGVTNDMDPFAGLITVNEDVIGQAQVAYIYLSTDMSATSDQMGVTNTTITSNLAALGIDWRHFGDLDGILRGMIDYIENNGGIIVPVELLSFEADRLGNAVSLNWKTATEHNSSHFDIERSVNDASSFVKVGEVSASGKTTAPVEYSAMDHKVSLGNTYYYRLKMVDADGEWEYSDVRKVEMTTSEVISIDEVYPNPASDDANIKLQVNGTQNVEIEVIDMTGSVVLTETMSVSGSRMVTLDVNELASGSYTVVLRVGEYSVTRKLTIVR